MVTGNVVLTDEEVLELQSQCQAYQSRATDYHDGEVATRARLAYEYYNGYLPAPINKGSSKHVSRDVWDGVNGVLQELISTFVSNPERAVKFQPTHFADGVGAEAATELVNKVISQFNDGYAVMTESWKEALLARNGFIKRYWHKHKKTIIEEFEDVTRQQLDQYLATIDGEIVELDTMAVVGEKVVKKGRGKKPVTVEDKSDVSEEKLKGRVVYEKHLEGVKLQYIPFEEVVIDPTARSLHDANYICHRVRKSKQDLIKLGFDQDKVDSLPTTALDIEGSGVSYARSNGLQPLSTLGGITAGDPRADKVWLYEAYIKTSVGSEDARLLQVFSCNGEVLEVNLVNEQPFHTFSPFPTPGSVWGESLFDILKEVQDLKTNLERGMLDNIMNANFRRYVGVKGAYNRESLMNNRPGSVIEVESDPAQLQPFQHHNLPVGIDVMLQRLDNDKEARTGTSKVAQGLDPNVFKNDNSTATVGMVMTQAQNRMRMIARNFANYGLIPLFKGIYDLYRLNGTRPIEVETAQGIVSLNPKELPERNNLVVAVAVGAGEKAERAAKLQSFAMMMTQIPALATFFQPENAYALAKDVADSLGLGNPAAYITPPDRVPAPQPNPEEQAQLAILQKQVESLDTQNQKIIHDMTMAQQKQEFEQQKAADEMHMKMEGSKSQQDLMADQNLIAQEQLQVSKQHLVLDSRKLDIKEKELLIQAQMEANQNRPISLRG